MIKILWRAALACVLGGAAASPALLTCRHISEKMFTGAVNAPRVYEAYAPPAGVVPHHLTAAPMIAGFFQALREAGAEYDTVVLVGPNHAGDIAQAVVSPLGWDINAGVECDTGLVEKITAIPLTDGIIVRNDARMEEDHAVSNLIPFVSEFLPGAKVAPLLVSRSLTYADTLRLAEGLTQIIAESDKNILLLCSIDFSHYLTPPEALAHDEITLDAIQKADYRRIHAFSNAYADSPASLIIFLQYLKALELPPQVTDHAEASEFIGPSLAETTSYFILRPLTSPPGPA